VKYNFDEVIDRSKNRSAKYDEREKKFGRKDVIPLWIADMDFKTAQPIIDAVKAKDRLLIMRQSAVGRNAAMAGRSTSLKSVSALA